MDPTRATASPAPAFHHLAWQVSEDGEGRHILEAMASRRATATPGQDDIETELQQVLDWSSLHFGDDQGPVDEGHAWDFDLQRHHEADGWYTVTLTLAVSRRFYEAFIERFGDPGAADA